MDINVNLKVPALEKLLDYTASGLGSVAGVMLAPLKESRQAKAKRIAAKADADVLRIRAEAQAGARSLLVSEGSDLTGELDISETVNQRIKFQERKRQFNMRSVVHKAAAQLVDKTVENKDPDHDWTARFFNEVQDVSSEEMQILWAKVLAGEVERPESTSIRTLGILRNLDQLTASLFQRFCLRNVKMDGNVMIPEFGNKLDRASIERFNEFGLVSTAPDFVVVKNLGSEFSFKGMVFKGAGKLEIKGAQLTIAGAELCQVLGFVNSPEFLLEFKQWYQTSGCSVV